MKLKREELIELSKKAISNAKALITEAELLYSNKHWARTVFLCHTAGEELGKSIECMSATMDLSRGVIDWKKFWKRFLSHSAKTKTIDAFETMMVGDPEPFGVYLKNLNQKANVLFQGRNATLYSAMMTNRTIFEPSDIVTEQMAEDSLSWGKARLRLALDVVLPLLDGIVAKYSDEEIKMIYNNLLALVNDPPAVEKLMTKPEDGQAADQNKKP
jgi:AbiV family abortive infection protein